MALSRKFIWVEINRDKVPELPKKFGVFAYPSLIVLGAKQENIFRFKSYMKAPEFIGKLKTGLSRYALYKAGKEWDLPGTRPAKICDVGEVKILPAPEDGRASGLAFLGQNLWVVQYPKTKPGQWSVPGPKKLRQVAWPAGEVQGTFSLEGLINDICSDGKVLYCLDYGWTTGKAPINVVDPKSGKTLRKIWTKANLGNRAHSARGITFAEGQLHVLDSSKRLVVVVDPKTGRRVRDVKLSVSKLSGLAHDGNNYVLGGKDHIYWFDARTGKLSRKIAVNYPVGCLAIRDGRLFLMEQESYGYDRQHRRVRIWPRKMVIYQLSLPTRK